MRFVVYGMRFVGSAKGLPLSELDASLRNLIGGLRFPDSVQRIPLRGFRYGLSGFHSRRNEPMVLVLCF